jgi:hypothetical protein
VVDYHVQERAYSCAGRSLVVVYHEKNWGRLANLTLKKERAVATLACVLRGYLSILSNCKAYARVSDRTIFFDQFNRVRVWVSEDPCCHEPLAQPGLCPEAEHDMVQMCFTAVERHTEGGQLPFPLYSFLESRLSTPMSFEETVACLEEFRTRNEQACSSRLPPKRKILLPRQLHKAF